MDNDSGESHDEDAEQEVEEENGELDADEDRNNAGSQEPISKNIKIPEPHSARIPSPRKEVIQADIYDIVPTMYDIFFAHRRISSSYLCSRTVPRMS